MGFPLQSPHVYKNPPQFSGLNRKNKAAAAMEMTRDGSPPEEPDKVVFKGDIIKPVSLLSMGMESDYDLSDYEWWE